MLSNKIPFAYFESLEKIDYSYLQSLGIKGLIFDLDNTIIPANCEVIPENKVSFLKKLEKNFSIVILTNNSTTRLLQAIQNNFNGISRAQKPNKSAFFKASKLLNLKKDQIAIIGDQILTDIKLANNVGVRSILVNPVDIKSDTFFTKFNRFFEMQFLLVMKDKYPAIFNKYFKSFYKSVRNEKN